MQFKTRTFFVSHTYGQTDEAICMIWIIGTDSVGASGLEHPQRFTETHVCQADYIFIDLLMTTSTSHTSMVITHQREHKSVPVFWINVNLSLFVLLILRWDTKAVLILKQHLWVLMPFAHTWTMHCMHLGKSLSIFTYCTFMKVKTRANCITFTKTRAVCIMQITWMECLARKMQNNK